MRKSKLETEIQFFEENREALCREHAGKVALVKGREFVGFFDTELEAYETGVEAFGIEPFMLKTVEPLEEELKRARASVIGRAWLRQAS